MDLGFPLFLLPANRARGEFWILDLGFPLWTIRCAQPSWILDLDGSSLFLDRAPRAFWILDLKVNLPTKRIVDLGFSADSGFCILDLSSGVRGPSWILDSGFQLDFDLTRSRLR